MSPDGLQLIATASGVVSVGEDEGRVHVESALVLERDVSAGQGNLEFIGDIVVQGSVGRGVAVRAGGSVHISGNVDVAVVQAGGAITIGGGILGRGAGVVRALGGGVTCRFIEDARVDAAGDIEVEDYVRNAQVRAGRRVTVKGTVVGGQVYGETGVRVRAAGNEQGTPTTLAAGVTLRAREQADKVRLHACALGERLTILEDEMRNLLAGEKNNVPLPADQRAVVLRAVAERSRLRALIAPLHEEKTSLNHAIEDARHAGVSVCVSEKAFARTRIAINDAALELLAATQYATFTRDDKGDIRLTALT